MKSCTWVALAVLSVPSLAARAPWALGNGFSLTVDEGTNHLSVAQGGRTIWETISRRPFLSASAGIDQVVDSSGNFNITQVDRNKCIDQQITEVSRIPWRGADSDHAIAVRGILPGCGSETARFSVALYVPAELPDRVAFDIDVSPDASRDALTKLFFTYSSSPSEDFYGLGGQASFASLKNQSVPIFSREQGVGRGDQPTTRLEDEDSYFAGGNTFTTYSAVPQYISSDARVFHLSQESTAYTTFDFRAPDAVTVRYAALHVNGYLMQANNMLDAVTMLTQYTGRMPELPHWVDTGAVLGIQGGQQKVNSIVSQGLELDCPIAAVWLQDW